MFRDCRFLVRNWSAFSKLGGDVLRGSPPEIGLLDASWMMLPVAAFQQARFRSTKHWNPKFKEERRKKFIKVELPDYEERRRESKLTVEEIRLMMKEKGIVPPRQWNERPIVISCSGGIFEAYVPPEGDGKVSLVSLPGAKQRLEKLEKKGSSMMAIRKIRKYEDEFELKPFAEKAQETYVEAHKALADKDEDKLHGTITERCYPEMTSGMARTTVRWTFLESLEPPRVVHARCTDIISKENIYGQVTVRMHTRQTLAIYDRFGRLMFGNEAVIKDVLEYVVFEKHLSNEYGTWRVHGKIVPEWLPPKDAFHRTFVREAPAPPAETSSQTSADVAR